MQAKASYLPSIKKNYFYQVIAAGSSILFPLITFPYIARTLEPAAFGKVSYVDFLAGLIISLSCIGIPLYGTREVAKYAHDKDKSRRLLAELLQVHILFTIAGIAFFFVFMLLHPGFGHEYNLLCLGSLYIISTTLSCEWYLQGKETFFFISMRSLFLRITGTAAIFIFVKNSSDYPVFYAIIAITQSAVFLLNLRQLNFQYLFRISLRQSFRKHFRLLLYFFIVTVFASIYDYIDTVLLAWLSTDEHVGYYSAAMKIVRLSLLVVLSLNIILFPRISGLHAGNHKQQASDLLNRSISFIFTLAVPLFFLFYLLASEIMMLFAGNAFGPSAGVMQWLSALPLAIALSNLFLLYFLSLSIQKKKVLVLVIAALAVSIILNLALVPEMKEIGAAIASVCTECFIMGGLALLLRIQIPLHTLWQPLFSSALFIPVVLLLQKLPLSLPIFLISTLLLCAILYFSLMFFVFKNATVRESVLFLGDLTGLKKK